MRRMGTSAERKAAGQTLHRVSAQHTLKLIFELGKDGAAVRQVAQIVLERGESSDCLSPDLEGRDAVVDPLLGVGDDIEDRLAQPGQCCGCFGSSRASRYRSIC